ncbi:MAG: hypothetical protein IKJ95_04820 [Bacteroidaceae bacterium]|nr:hypothetical protein [Bacteroidaceae bacterium]
MKQNLLFILIIGLCAGLSSCGKEEYMDYEVYGLNTPVKSVKVKTYKAISKFGEVTKGDMMREGNYRIEFNSAGNIETMKQFDENGELSELIKCKFKDDGVYMTEMCAYDKEDKEIYRIINEYDGDYVNKTTREHFFDFDSTVHTTEFKRDGKWITEAKHYRNGELVSKVVYSKNDESGSEWIEYAADGSKETKGSIELDEWRLTKRCMGDFCCTVEWNEKNLPVYVKNATLFNNTLIAFTADEGSVFYAEYEYDKEGNWIKQIIYKGDNMKPYSISIRDIDYGD